jgi:threonine/homoserine/homoserine lactone efflux protein
MELALMGLGLGLVAGISPGPLLTLVVSSTLERGFGAGFRVALAPVITDAPIILLALLVLRELPPSWLALVATLGGCLVIYVGIETLRIRDRGRQTASEAGGNTLDLWRGALVNLLNPHPWIFWVTVQGPMLIEGWRRNPLTGISFVAAFYLAIVTSKVCIAWIVDRGRQALTDRWYRGLLSACGISLVGLGALLVVKGLTAAF